MHSSTPFIQNCKQLSVLFIMRMGLGDALAQPSGPAVLQGSATFSTQGSRFTVTTSDRAFIKWDSFNIGAGQTTRFEQPSSSSLVWNQINDTNPSQILGNLSANGYVVLQNQSGFYIGGAASITAKGLMLTTAPTAMPDLSSGGAWQFSAPPPAASIVNYGQIILDKGGSAFLIARDIQNHGTISASKGNIGLYAGKEVLVSERPDGRGLAAKVRLPEGSVDNTGNLVADAGQIAMRAQVVNQRGLVQANSVLTVNGTIELVASDSVKLGPNSITQAKGDATGTSQGGFVVVNSGGVLTDSSTARIDVSGAGGGKTGFVELFGQGLSSSTVAASIDGLSAVQFSTQNHLLINPYDLALSSAPTIASASSPNLGLSDLSGYSQIDLHAAHNIELQAAWSLVDPGSPAMLELAAGNSLIFDSGSRIAAGDNWSLNLSAGPHNLSAAPADKNSRTAGIYLAGGASLQTGNGGISLWAENEIKVTGTDNTALTSGIRTVGGGGILAKTVFGDVNSGVNPNGYLFQRNAPYYRVSTANLGGISTAAGGNVTLDAGGDVVSFLPLLGQVNSLTEGGSGAFGPQAGNVTVKAGGSVYGHYVVANGTGKITAGSNVGGLEGTKNVALSLVKGSWKVEAPNGSIYLQEVRNPNGVFNDSGNINSSAGYHLFDYDPLASVALNAGDSVRISGANAPRIASTVGVLPNIFPPSLQVTAGAGGVQLGENVTLFPSPNANLGIVTTGGGSLAGSPDANGVTPFLLMSDSEQSQWGADLGRFGIDDHSPQAPTLKDYKPVNFAISGSIKNLSLYTTKETTITVGGDMINTSFVGRNLRSGDKTSIQVAGQIYNRPGYTFVFLDHPIESYDKLQPFWNLALTQAVQPNAALQPIPLDATAADIATLAANLPKLFAGSGSGALVYNTTTRRLGFSGRMSSALRDLLTEPLFVVRYDDFGNPVLENGHLALKQVGFIPASTIEALYAGSQDVPLQPLKGYQIGGPGQFNISAASMELGNSAGVLSWGTASSDTDPHRNDSLIGTVGPGSGAAINITLGGDLSMFTSTIASVDGGNVCVTSKGGMLNLGSQELLGGTGGIAFGIYTSGHSDVKVTAAKDININGSRIAAYNGGSIQVESLTGDVKAGSGGNAYVNVPLAFLDPNTHVGARAPIYGSGIVAVSLPMNLQTPGGNPLPGNITVSTPRGNIVSSSAGILQLALDGNVGGGPTITLTAGTKAVPASGPDPGIKAVPGNIDLGNSGVIGGTVNLTAEGDIKGLVVSRQDSSIHAAQNITATVLSGGTATVGAGGNVGGTIIGVGTTAVSGGQGISADVKSQNASIGGGPAQSTLGTVAATTAASQSAAQQSSSDAKEQLASKTSQEDEDDKKKHKGPVIKRRSRVTVILPKAI